MLRGSYSSRFTSLTRFLSRPSAVAVVPEPHPSSPATSPFPPPPAKPPSTFRSSLSSLLSHLPSFSFLPRLESLTQQAEREALTEPSPYDFVTAHVERRSRSLDGEEAAYIARRKQSTLPHLQRLVHPDASLPPSSAPTVAVCLSGGGYRAMLGSLAALSSLDDMGVLPASAYVSGLSGSTWAMSQLYSAPQLQPPSAARPSGVDFASVVTRVREQAAHPLFSWQSPAVEALLPVIRRSLLDKLHFSSQSLTMSDVLSWFISRRILSSIPTPDPSPSSSFLASLTLSGQRQSLSSATLPFPLYTAVSSPDLVQFEFSPYSMGSWELSAFIPTWAFNRPFHEGRSTSPFPHEPHLSTLLSVFSSAHCSDLATQLTEVAMQMRAADRVKEGVREVVERLKKEWRLADVRPFEAIAFNSPFLTLPPSPLPLPPAFTSRPSLSLMDAGLAFNFPLVPLVQPARGVDVVVLVDFTSPPEAMNAAYLHTARRYCRAHGLPLPDWTDGRQPLGRLVVKGEESAARTDISVGEGVGQTEEVEALHRACHSRVTVFEGKGRVPTVVYVPLLSNEAFDAEFCPRRTFEAGGFTATLNFVYSEDESGKLMGLVDTNLRECEGAIKEAVADKWRDKAQQQAAPAPQ